MTRMTAFDMMSGPSGGVGSTPGDHFTAVTLLGGTTMPQEPIPAPVEEQPAKLRSSDPVSKTTHYRRLKQAKELGIPVDQLPDRRGQNQNRPKGSAHYRWNADGRIFSEEGYIKVRVGVSHPLADPNGYAYEHLVVWVAAGRPRPIDDEVIHHHDEDKSNNRLDNLELKTRGEHNAHHNADRSRDQMGRLLPTKSRIEAAEVVATYLAECLPLGAPACYRRIVSARFEGSGRKRLAVADLEMFDGLAATVEVFQWAPGAYGHSWRESGQPLAFYEDGRWQRDAAGRTLDGVIHNDFPMPTDYRQMPGMWAILPGYFRRILRHLGSLAPFLGSLLNPRLEVPAFVARDLHRDPVEFHTFVVEEYWRWFGLARSVGEQNLLKADLAYLETYTLPESTGVADV